jgi:DNA-binding transcriptional LysR family regulator
MARKPLTKCSQLTANAFNSFRVKTKRIKICYEAGFSPNITQEAHELQNVISLVASGMGVALVPFSMKNL